MIFAGVVVVSILIGLISDSVAAYMETLEEGTTKVIEKVQRRNQQTKELQHLLTLFSFLTAGPHADIRLERSVCPSDLPDCLHKDSLLQYQQFVGEKANAVEAPQGGDSGGEWCYRCHDQ